MLIEVKQNELSAITSSHRKQSPMRVFANGVVEDMAAKPAGAVCEVTGFEEHASAGVISTPCAQCYSAVNAAIHAAGKRGALRAFTAKGRLFIERKEEA